MSLNGLDNATVREAHEAAVAEPGGWFLLKYASRDEVEVYCRGTTGIVEMRNAIAKYEETSPLYGFLKYRRRNVIVKYQPDDCSRLVQARATVHFNAVCERFTPYNTTFEITEAKELKDTKLSAACSLHAASGSFSSSNSSLRRRRLMEITEEEEEEERERKRQSVVQEEERPGTSGENDTRSTLSSPEPPVVLDKAQIEESKEPNFASTAEAPSFEGVRPSSPSKSDFIARDDRRLSSQTARPDLYSYSSYTYGKPRVKLAPRPSIESNKKPHTAGNFRPVAALPAGFKLASKGSRKGRSGSHDQTSESEEHDLEQETSDLAPLNVSVTIPEVPQESRGDLLPPRPNTSSGASLKSISSMTAAKEAKITPEKARLMKAMKMRQQKKQLSLMATEPAFVAPGLGLDGETKIEEQPEESGMDNESGLQEKEEELPLAHADSAIAVDLPTPMTVDTEAADDTFTDSHPASPTIASSEVGESTKASSLSESTDETVQAPKYDEGNNDIDPVGEGLDWSNGAKPSEPIELASPILPADPVVVEDETHDANVSAHRDRPVVQEFASIPQDTEKSAGSTHDETAQESIEVDDEPIGTSAVRRQEVVLPQERDDEAVSPKSPYGLPVSRFASNDSKSPTTPSLKSKFSTQDLKNPSEPVPPLPTVVAPAAPGAFRLEPAEEAVHSDPSDALQDTLAKRKVSVSAIRTDLTRDTPEPELQDPLLDDDLMDELQSATFEEAQPMIVSKSPITPVFPSTSPKRPQTVGGSRDAPLRSFSNPMRGPLLVPGDVSSSSARSVSAGGAAFLHNITRQPSTAGLSTKKPTGGSIAQRIKALEQLSGKPGAEEARPRTATPSSSFISVRKPTVRDSSKSPVPSFAERANSMTRQTPPPDESREGSPDISGALKPRERSGSVASRLSKFEAGSQAPRGRPESIQVTARIVRDSNTSFPKRPSSKDPAEYDAADLKQSPLVVDHLKAVPEPMAQRAAEPVKLPAIETPKETIQERRLSRDRKASIPEDDTGRRRRSSLSIVRDFIKDRRTSVSSKSTDNLAVLSPAPSAKSPSRPPSVHQTSGSSLSRRLSISSRRSSISQDHDNSTPLMSPAAATDHSSDDTDRVSLSDKKSKSRTSRFMRRLSNSLVATRKNASPNTPTTVREEEEVVSDVSTMAHSRNPSQPALAAYMGDVNVQFPDNLLWKRRSLCLDTHGFLILNTINGTEKAGVKRYHLSEFRTPYIPDVDMQELPNSICLDFVEGSSLQLACEDRQGQKHTLGGEYQLTLNIKMATLTDMQLSKKHTKIILLLATDSPGRH
ncbi:gpi-anchored cell surface glycoprotein [Seiridium cupressi]